MSAVFREVQHPAILWRQFNAEPFAKRRRLRPQIQHDVEDGTPRTTDQLGFEVGSHLIMHAPRRSFFNAESHVRLDWNEIDAVGIIEPNGKKHWAISAEASSTYADPHAQQPLVPGGLKNEAPQEF